MKTNTEYNGWKNRSTWDVSLWINNDESLYKAAKEYMQTKHNKPYSGFIRHMNMQYDKTPDGIKYISTLLDYKALNGMMEEL